ncbi:MAG: TetR family transcriptional regulator [Mycobacterium sp.]|jgi:AcrR family transcriptional regulator|uniref:TetR family transcriptional regulator n=1 Tax=Mycobacterium sp. TaxID=1785 RepID=UPI00320191AA
MSRWQPNARGRLEQAALELYTERGFDQTTVAEIAERAGLTERTFFRHFADKREVLFWGQDALMELVTKHIADAPDSASPIDAVGGALRAVGEMFGGRREHSRRRQAVIAANPGLQERELIKLASLAAVMAEGLGRRGVAEPAAKLTAETAVAVFKVAFERWINATGDDDLTRVIDDSLDELKALTAGT